MGRSLPQEAAGVGHSCETGVAEAVPQESAAKGKGTHFHEASTHCTRSRLEAIRQEHVVL